MACSSCATKDGQPKGCKNNGTCGTDGCNKLTVFDWLSNMSLPSGVAAFNFVEVRFKNGRKGYYKFGDNLSLSMGDVVATQAASGHDVGIVSLAGELVRVQMKKKNVPSTGNDVLKIYRKASQKDIDIWQSSRDKEEKMKVRAREIAIRLELKMKISDIEFQGDGSKATFYYTAEDRVDFRQLIKDYAKEFSIRIEMRQIGFRQEAARLGGVGSCGRELCCSTWLTDFRSVNTSAARYQQLSLNPQKLAGQCGKLKCCLNYELDAYLEALNDFPKTDTKIYTDKGVAVCQKVDIFKGILWYAYEGDWVNWYTITTEDANEMISLNEQKKKVSSLEMYSFEDEKAEIKVDFENVVGQDSLTRFDKPKRRNRRRPKRKTDNNTKSQKEGNSQSNNNNKNQVAAKRQQTPQKKRRPNNNNNNNRNRNNSAKAQPNDTVKKATTNKNTEVKPKKKPYKKRTRPNNRKQNNPNTGKKTDA